MSETSRIFAAGWQEEGQAAREKDRKNERWTGVLVERLTTRYVSKVNLLEN